MLKNFSPAALGINGRQSELIELALTYGFTGMDVDMHEMLRRAQRTNVEDAAKYLEAAKIEVGGFELGIDLDADEDAFTSQLGGLHPIADMAKQLGATRGYIRVPAATNRLPYHEYFDVQGTRLAQIAQVLEPRGIKLGIGFAAGKELEEDKEFAFIRNVEGYLALVNSVAGENVGMLLDTWDWVVGDGAMDQLSEVPVEKIVAVRMGSVHADAESGKETSSDRVLPEQEGGLNHVNVIKHLDSIGFDGPVSPSASNQSYKGQTRESIVQRAQEAVDGISKEAGLTVAKLPMETIEDIPYEPNPIS
ncbi:MAG: TIM barrel protein [Planctomycetaceae bacterium]|nr:TIM barrel protein [Planctomycetaceae bacterium]